MKIVGVVVVMALVAGPAWAQIVPKYGEPDPEKTKADIAAEKEAERAYRRSLDNIQEQKSSDPWGTVRVDGASKAAAKAPAAKAPAAKAPAAKAPAAKPKAKSADIRTDGAAK
jgi:hypothetical protein